MINDQENYAFGVNQVSFMNRALKSDNDRFRGVNNSFGIDLLINARTPNGHDFVF